MRLWKHGDEPPRFSVVVPAVDEAAVIGDCLDSLLAQDVDASVQIVVVDNGSTDRTAAIAADRGATVVSESSRGVCFARQRGLVASIGDIVVSTDADTTFARGWLRGVDAGFRAHPDAVAVAGPCRYVDGPRWGGVWTALLFGAVDRVQRSTGYVGYVTATNLAFRRSALTHYDTRLTQGGDELDVLRRLRARGRVVWDAGNPTYTSSRRLERGLVHTLFVSFGYYYLFAYGINRLLRRPVLGTAPRFRTDGRRRWVPVMGIAAALGLLLVAWAIADHEHLW